MQPVSPRQTSDGMHTVIPSEARNLARSLLQGEIARFARNDRSDGFHLPPKCAQARRSGLPMLSHWEQDGK